MLQIIFIIGLFVGTVFTSFTAQHASNQWQGSLNSDSHYLKNVPNFQHISSNNLLQFHGHAQENSFSHNDNNSIDKYYNSVNQGHTVYNHDNFDHPTHWNQNDYDVAQNVPVSQHVEITRPVSVPVVKNIGIPIPHPVAIPIPHAVVVGVPQPYPVHVPVAQAVPIPVIRTVAVPVEKKVPYAIEKIIPVPVEKPIAVAVEKYIPVPVEKPYPIHIPIYKHIFHKIKGHNHQDQRRIYRRRYSRFY